MQCMLIVPPSEYCRYGKGDRPHDFCTIIAMACLFEPKFSSSTPSMPAGPWVAKSQILIEMVSGVLTEPASDPHLR